MIIQRASAIFDEMLSFRILNKEALEITTMACLLVAVKLEEKDLQLVNSLLTWFEEP